MMTKSSLRRLLPTCLALAPFGVPATGTAQSTAYTQKVIADGPVLYWSFDQPLLGDGVAPQVGSPPVTTENDLVPVGGASRIAHAEAASGLRLGNAASFDGSGYFKSTVPLRAPKAQLTGAYAVEMWFQSLAANNGTYFLNFGIAPGGDNAPAFIYNFQGPVLEIFGGGGGRTGAGGPAVEDGNWHHLMCVYYGNGVDGVAARTEIYLDGVSAPGLEPFARRLSLDTLIVGAGLSSPLANAFTGNLDELAVYDLSALNLPDEPSVEAWAAGLAARHRASAAATTGPAYATVVEADQPMLYWNFDEEDAGAAIQRIPLATSSTNVLVAQGAPVLTPHTEIASGLLLGGAAEVSGAGFFTAKPLVAGEGVTSLAPPYALEFWVQSLSDNASTYVMNFGDFTAQGDNSPALIYNFAAAPRYLEVFSGAGGRTALSGPQITDQNWHHVVIGNYGGGGAGVADRMDIYVDTIRYERAGPVTQPLSLGGLVVGAALANGINGFFGRIDELAVYDLSALPTEAEVTTRLAAMVGSHFTASGAAAPTAEIVINQPPAGGPATLGDVRTFTVAATVTGTNEPLLYQWFRDGLALTGETGETYTTPPLSLRDIGTHNYTVRLTAGAAFKESAAAAVVVPAPPPLAPTAYSLQVLADAPLLYWNFDEAQGPALQKAPLAFAPAEAVNDLAPSGGASRADHAAIESGRKLGYTADFAGNGHFRTLLTTGLGDLTGPFGIELWLQSTGVNTATYLANFGNHTVAGGDNRPSLIYNFTAGYLELFGAGRTAAEGPALADEEWHHVFYVYYGNGGNGVAPLVEIHMDGVPFSIANGAPFQLGLEGALVGAALPNGVNSFTGRIDELALYDFSEFTDETALRNRVETLVNSHLSASTMSPPTAAVLNVSTAGTTATLTWTAAAGTVLQESPDLVTWTTVNGAASPYTLTLPGGGKKFFRLARP